MLGFSVQTPAALNQQQQQEHKSWEKHSAAYSGLLWVQDHGQLSVLKAEGSTCPGMLHVACFNGKRGMIVTVKLCQGTLVQRLGQMRCLIGWVVNCKHAACGGPALAVPDLICLPFERSVPEMLSKLKQIRSSLSKLTLAGLICNTAYHKCVIIGQILKCSFHSFRTIVVLVQVREWQAKEGNK